MSGFSRTEYAFARLLSRTPVLKKSLKYFWQQLNHKLNRSAVTFDCRYPVVRLTESGKIGFFGYYDLSPMNEDGSHVVFHQLQGSSLKADRANIILMDLKTGSKTKIGDTSMFNLQSGSRLQWMNDHEVLFNKEKEDCSGCGTVRYDMVTGQSRFYDFPVFCTAKTTAFSINLSAAKASGNEYGYRSLNSFPKDESMISAFDFDKEVVKMILPLEKLLSFGDRGYPTGSKHTVNHLMISPDNDNIIFIHRWYSASGKSERLLMMQLSTGDLKTLNDEMTSHCCWLDSTTVLGYMRHRGKDGYYSVTVSGEFKEWESPFDGDPVDGHPSCEKGKVVFDTYPDKCRMQSLFIRDRDRIELVGKFFSPIMFDPYYRCDLHPRWDPSASKIFIDSEHEGERGLYMIELPFKPES